MYNFLLNSIPYFERVTLMGGPNREGNTEDSPDVSIMCY